jgi:hypothetical protein
MFAVGGSALLFWLLLIYLPGEAYTFQGSYATIVLLCVACAAVIGVLPRGAVRALVALQLGYFGVMWVAAVWRTHVLHWSSVGLSVLSAAALLAYLAWLGRRVDEARSAAPAPPPGQRVATVPVLAWVAPPWSGDGVHDSDERAEDRVPEQAQHGAVVDGEHGGAAP